MLHRVQVKSAASQPPRVSGMRISDGATTRQTESAQSWLSSYLGQCEADLRLLASQRVRSIEIKRDDQGILLDA